MKVWNGSDGYRFKQIDADWSNIDRLRSARARADRICNWLVCLLVPTVALATILLSHRWS